jgi:RimJ/RimL family protein N-acetyltransferase
MTQRSAVGESATNATLLDGAEVTVRRLTRDNYDDVVQLATELSAEERYMRFFTLHPGYIGEWALSLTAPAKGVVALGAFETNGLIGVANYTELNRPGYAEIAVVVAHEQHDRGVGTVLLRALAVIARASGQHRFVADVLFENYAMRRILSDAGWPVSQHRDGSVLSIEADLDELVDAGLQAAQQASASMQGQGNEMRGDCRA